MSKVRVLVVDDSVVVRRLVSEVLGSDPGIEVVATAPNGKVALQRLDNADLVVLDVEMPELDGLATLAQLRKKHPKLPVIMFSTLTSRGAESTIDALSLGANDYVMKPTGGLESSRAQIRDQLIPRIKALCPRTPVAAILPRRIASITATTTPIGAIAIGVSTGGPPALHELLSQLPADFPVPIFIVQHMPPQFTTMLAARLGQATQLPVVEVTAGRKVEPGRVYLAAGDFHLVVDKTPAGMMLRTHQEPPECSCRPSVDVLFRSVATAYGASCVAVVLTGMGNDGARGSELIRAAGGAVIAQDLASSVVWGMPGAVVRNGAAETVLPLDQISRELVRRVRPEPRLARRA